MAERNVTLFRLAAMAALLAMGVALSVRAQGLPRIPFVIATGPTGGTYFPIGEAIAGIISHPPGVYRCERGGVCGPTGLIASARTSPGTVFNVIAVNARTVDAALAQSDVIAEAIAGRGRFAKTGPQKHLRAIAGLFPEDVHLIASKRSHIKAIADLRGKRVGVGPDSSGTTVSAHAVFVAYRLPQRRLKLSNDPSDLAAEKLAEGKLDAIFFVGGAPVPLVRDLLASEEATLIPISGSGRIRLLRSVPTMKADTIPAGVYPKTGKIETVSVRAIWIVNDSVPASIAYAVTRALFNPANRQALTGSHRSAQFIRLDDAVTGLPVQLHAGAARFYAEHGKLLKAPPRSGKT